MTLHIGIVDVTTVGSTICQMAIVEKAAMEDTSGKHPEFSVHSFSFDLYKKLVTKSDWAGMANLISDSIKKLCANGADFIIIPSNTPHYAIKEIQSRSPVPVLNLIEITVEECCHHNFKKVSILGTKQTMEGNLYAKPLAENKITLVIPNNNLQNEIDTLIYKIIKRQAKREEIETIAQQLKLIDCEAFILGCTELPDVYNDKILGKPCIDTTRLLAKKALEYAKKNPQKSQQDNKHQVLGI